MSALTQENMQDRAERLTRWLDGDHVPKDDIEATTAFRDGLVHGLSLMERDALNEGCDRRGAIAAQKEKACTRNL